MGGRATSVPIINMLNFEDGTHQWAVWHDGSNKSYYINALKEFIFGGRNYLAGGISASSGNGDPGFLIIELDGSKMFASITSFSDTTSNMNGVVIGVFGVTSTTMCALVWENGSGMRRMRLGRIDLAVPNVYYTTL